MLNHPSNVLQKKKKKSNNDVIHATLSVAISVVARNWREELVFSCSKRANTTLSLSLSLSLQAKVEVVLWVFKIGREIGIESICVESESKVFVDALVFLCQGIP